MVHKVFTEFVADFLSFFPFAVVELVVARSAKRDDVLWYPKTAFASGNEVRFGQSDRTAVNTQTAGSVKYNPLRVLGNGVRFRLFGGNSSQFHSSLIRSNSNGVIVSIPSAFASSTT